MSHRTKSGWKQRRQEVKQRWKRREKKRRQALIEAGHLKKGRAPAPSPAA